MRIGIVGTGNMGRALGRRWAGGGHQVLFGSRDLRRARAAAAGGRGSMLVGNHDAAALFGDVVLYTVRDLLPSRLLLTPHALAGKIVIDCNNSTILGLDTPDPSRRPGVHFTRPVPSLAERLAADEPRARVVKAFNTIPAKVIEIDREQLVRRGLSAFLCSDDTQAKSVVARLAEELGFVSVDTGGLERARLVEAVADFIRFQVGEMGPHRFETMPVDLALSA